MATTFTQPLYSRRRVNLAGETLRQNVLSGPTYDEALRVINNWRSSHSYPLNTFQMDLRKKVKATQEDVLVAQRTKRLTSIRSKLIRHPTLDLTQMQDIGGCRAIVEDVAKVQEIVERYDNSRFEHILHNQKDYIQFPSFDGYRGFHLIYKYRGRKEKSVYNDLRIEIQLRSNLQHVWATAVEAVDLFTGQSLKLKQGEPRWKRFFALMSCVIAEREHCPTVPGCPGSDQIVSEIRQLAEELRADLVLSGITVSLEHVGETSTRQTKYFVARLNLAERRLFVKQFTKDQSSSAHSYYLREEKKYSEDNNFQIYLVSVDSAASLQRAYPNFFLDAHRFRALLNEVI